MTNPTLKWNPRGEQPPINQTVLGCLHFGWDRYDDSPKSRFELFKRKRVGDICGESHPDRDEVIWYAADYGSAYKDDGPDQLLCWALLEAPEEARVAVAEAKQ